MKEQFASLPTWLDVVPFAAEFAQDALPDGVVSVDVGDGNESQCTALKKSLPELRSRVILQDHSFVLEQALEVGEMEKMP